MAKVIKSGPVSIEVPDHLELPKEAGSLTLTQVRALPKARQGIGVACEAAAEALANAELDFVAPKGITPEALRRAGARAEGMDNFIRHLELVVEMFKQANFLVDAEALELLGRLNDQVKAQGKRNKAIATAFSGVTAYFKNTRSTTKRAKAGDA